MNAFSWSISKSVNKFTSSPECEIFPSEHKVTLQKLTCEAKIFVNYKVYDISEHVNY